MSSNWTKSPCVEKGCKGIVCNPSGNGDNVFTFYNHPYISSNAGITFSQNTGVESNPNDLIGVISFCISSDGMFIAVTKVLGLIFIDNVEYLLSLIYITRDRGISWDQTQVTQTLSFWNKIICDSTGNTVITYSTDNNTIPGYIVKSTDSGFNWTILYNSPFAVWNDICCSSNGQIIYGVTSYKIYGTTNGGTTWSEKYSNLIPQTRLVSISCSSDGSKIVVILTGGNIENYAVYGSQDGGSTWNQINTNGYTFLNIKISGDGTKLVGIVSGNKLLISSDFGSNWVEKNLKDPFELGILFDLSINNNASKIFIADILGGTSDIFISTDGGNTIIKNGSTYTYDWSCLDVNNTGNSIVPAVLTGYIYLSNDRGNSWLLLDNPNLVTRHGWSGISVVSSSQGDGISTIFVCSYDASDNMYKITFNPLNVQDTSINDKLFSSISCDTPGTNVVVCEGGFKNYTNTGFIYLSTDGGLNYNQIINYEYSWTCVKIIVTPTSEKLIFACSKKTNTEDGKIYLTSDSGTNWNLLKTSNTGDGWKSIAVSSDGNYIAACEYGGYIYVSNDRGTTWSSHSNSSSLQNWTSITSDTTGQYLVAGADGGQVFSSKNYGVTWISQTTPNSFVNTNLIQRQIDQRVITGGPTYVSSNSSGTNVVALINNGPLINTNNSGPACFNEGTKILCLINNKEEYIPIETMCKGTLVKTYKHGYKKVDLIGKNCFINNPTSKLNSMYKMEKTNNNTLIEDLIITGGHGIMVDELSNNEIEAYKKSGAFRGKPPKIEGKILLLANLSDKCVQINNNNTFTYYHFTLENGGNDNQRYLVWANGILSETPSKKQYMKYEFVDII